MKCNLLLHKLHKPVALHFPVEATTKNIISLVCILNTRFTANLIIVSFKILLTFGCVKQFL